MATVDPKHPGWAWQRWHTENASMLPREVECVRWQGTALQIEFAGVNPNLEFLVTELGATTAVVWQGECVDLILDVDADPELQPTGKWQCRLCDEHDRKSHETLDAFWKEEVFEAWASHLREILQPDMWVLIYFRTRGGSSEARAVRAADAAALMGEAGWKYGFRVLSD